MSFASGVDSRSMAETDLDIVKKLSPEERDGYMCDVNKMVGTMDAISPREMLGGLVTLDSVRYRKAWQR